MAHSPAIFDASAFFGNSNSQKGQQDPLWGGNFRGNHSTGAFDGNATPLDPFMSNAQGYVDGWGDWPEDDEFLGDDSALQNHLTPDNSDTPKLIVPQNWSSSSSAISDGMDPELNAWTEEETTPPQQTKTYASACRAGMAWPPGYQEHWAPPISQQVFSAPDEHNAQENTTPEPWSREPELGSWSPVFNHNDGSFLTLQKGGPASSLFANNGVDYQGNQQAVDEPSAVPAQDYSAPNRTSQQELLPPSAHSFASNSTFYSSNQQTLPPALSQQVSMATAPAQDQGSKLTFEQFGMANVPAQYPREPTATSQDEMPTPSSHTFPASGAFYQSNQQMAPEQSDFFQQVGMPIVPGQDLERTGLTPQQELPSSSAHLFPNNSSSYPNDQQVVPETESFQQGGVAMTTAQDHRGPAVKSMSSPAHLFTNNSDFYPHDEQPTPEIESFQQVGMTSQDHRGPVGTSQLFANDSNLYPNDDQLTPETDLQHVNLATVPAQDNRTLVPTSQQVPSLPVHLFAGNSTGYQREQQATPQQSTDFFQQGSMAVPPVQDHGGPTMTPQYEVPSSSGQLFSDNNTIYANNQQVTTEMESFQQVGMTMAPVEDHGGPTMSSQQEFPSSSGQLFADNNTIDQQVTTETESFQQFGMTMAPVEDHGVPTVSSQQTVLSPNGQLFADGNTIYANNQQVTTEAESFQQVGMTTPPAQDHGGPIVSSQQAVPSSARHLFADNNTFMNPSNQQVIPEPSGGMAMAPARDYMTPVMTSQQAVPSSAGHLFADNNTFMNPSNQQVIPEPSGGMAMAPARDYMTPVMTSQQAVPLSSGQLFADNNTFMNPSNQQVIPEPSGGMAMAPARDYMTPVMTSQQMVPSSARHLFADNNTFMNPSNQQVIPEPSGGMAMAPARDYMTPVMTSQQTVPSSARHLFADNNTFMNPSNQQVIPEPSGGMAMAPAQDYMTLVMTSQQAVPSSSGQLFADNGTFNPNDPNMIPGQSAGVAMASVASSSAQLFAEDGFHFDDQRAVQPLSAVSVKPVMDRVVHNFEEPFVDNTIEQAREGEQDSTWSSITEKDIQQVDLWGNLPDVKRPKDVKPPSGEKVLDQKLSHNMEATSNVFNQQQEQVSPPPKPETNEKDSPVEPDSPRDALQVAFLQKQLAGKVPAASPRTSLWMNTSGVLPTPCVLAPAAIVPPVDPAPPSDKQLKGQLFPAMPALVPVEDMATVSQDTATLPGQKDPVDVAPKSVGHEVHLAGPLNAEYEGINSHSNDQQLPPIPAVPPHQNFTLQQEAPQNNFQGVLEGLQSPAKLPPQNARVLEAAPSLPPPPPMKTPVQDQNKESSAQMSLVALLQGGKGRLKKKNSQQSATPISSADVHVESLQNASNSPATSNLSSSSSEVASSGQPSVPLSSTDQVHHVSGELSQDSSQLKESRSFDSDRRTGELEHSRERDYGDPRDRPRSREDSYYDHQRDPYYHQDGRDPYDNYNRRESSHDYDRPYYDRKDSERRNYDCRRDYDRRDSDYGRRSYDREYDRRSYDGRDYPRRDSYDNRDSYYGQGYSTRQGRQGYDHDNRSSREDLYRGSYHSGRSTPSSDRNSPAPYDYSAYASQQYGYPSYTDPQSMDLYQYQYLMYLYQFHPQHYEQYCAQLGYYNMGYTPEQMAQYYGGMYNSSGYASTEATEQAQVVATPESTPERFTPMLYRVQHPLVKFSGSRLVSLIDGEDGEAPRCTITSVQMVFSVEEIEVIKMFPGPLSRYSSRTEVIAYCENRSTVTVSSPNGVVKSLVWKVLANLVKHNGAFVAADLAEIIMTNWRSCNSSAQHEFISPDSCPPAEVDSHRHIQVYREMLLAGATKEALEYCMHAGLWGHAMLLASKMDKKVHNDVTTRFLKTMTDFDPIRTVYDHLSGRQPVALMTTDDWQRNLAAMVANPPRQHSQCIKKNMMCLGDTLMSNEQVWEAHVCYLLAGEQFGFPTEAKTKMSLIGVDHRTTMITDRHLPLENLQMMEVLEYAVSLNNEEHHIPVLQSYKFMLGNKLAEAGFTEEALHYAELIGYTVIKHPTNANTTLVKNTRELIDRLNPETLEATELMEMLDKVLQAKNSPSQISSSVTESESEPEEPLAESSASFFSGYDQSTNTPKHQAETVEDVQSQLSYTEPAVSDPPVQQESMAADIRQDSWSSSVVTGKESWSEGMDTQAAQPDLPPTMVPQAPEPALQPPFFVPGPPVAQPFPEQMGRETAEEQPVYGNQWSEAATYEEAKNFEPIPPKDPKPSKKEEEKPKAKTPEKKKKEAKRSSPIGGWLSGLFSKMMPRGPNEMILPDDTKKSIYWDEDLKRWVNVNEDEQDKAPPPPPPTDMQLGAGGPPMMPLGNAANAVGATSRVAGGPMPTPFSSPSVPAPRMPQQPTPGGISAGMATPPTVSKFSRKAYGGGRLAKKYVDVLNPSGQSSNGPAMLPSSLLPSFPGPTTEFNPAKLFIPAPVPVTSDDTSDPLTTTEPVVGNPGSRPSSRNDEEDGGDQQSQHSRSSSVSLTSAEVRSYMMPQIPDPPPQNVAPVFYDPSAFSQPKAQATPRRSRYPGQIRK